MGGSTGTGSIEGLSSWDNLCIQVSRESSRILRERRTEQYIIQRNESTQRHADNENMIRYGNIFQKFYYAARDLLA